MSQNNVHLIKSWRECAQQCKARAEASAYPSRAAELRSYANALEACAHDLECRTFRAKFQIEG